LCLGPGPPSLLHLTRANAEKPYAGDTRVHCADSNPETYRAVVRRANNLAWYTTPCDLAAPHQTIIYLQRFFDTDPDPDFLLRPDPVKALISHQDI
jgi:hypothetical protein